jgi:hypothetical protein
MRLLRIQPSLMVTSRRSTEIAAIRQQEQTDRVLRILRENPKGMTSAQIAKNMETGLPRNLLLELQRKGLIRQTRGLSSEGKIAFLYLPSKGATEREK